jgi:hypothetical protein
MLKLRLSPYQLGITILRVAATKSFQNILSVHRLLSTKYYVPHRASSTTMLTVMAHNLITISEMGGYGALLTPSGWHSLTDFLGAAQY